MVFGSRAERVREQGRYPFPISGADLLARLELKQGRRRCPGLKGRTSFLVMCSKMMSRTGEAGPGLDSVGPAAVDVSHQTVLPVALRRA